MEWAIGGILRHYRKDRALAIWGTGPKAFTLTGHVARNAPISFYISNDPNKKEFLGKPVYAKDACSLSPETHYVVILADPYYGDIRQELIDAGFQKYEDYYDWYSIFGHPIDIEYQGVRIGKGSYGVPNPWCIRSVGRYTSINVDVQFNRDHAMGIITTSPLGNASILSPEKAAMFNQKTPYHYPNNDRITIGNDVWIGANVFINVSKVSHIGDGAIIGSNSLVLHDVPPYAIVYGTPARVQRYRFTPEQIEILLRVKWWDWENETINKNIEFLMNPEKFFERFG